jgi:predicted acylesterase/phospholipase RssA
MVKLYGLSMIRKQAKKPHPNHRTALLLGGGGARAA